MDKSRSREDMAGETRALREWRERLREELKRRKIPAAWQIRLMEELDDHLFDLKEERMSTTDLNAAAVERLGQPEQIAEAAATECRKLGFFAQRPVLTYFVGPLVMVPVAFVAFLFLFFFFLFAAGLALDEIMYIVGAEPPHDMNPAANGIASALVLSTRFVPFAFFAWMFCHFARRHGRGWRCVLSACTVVAVYAGLFSMTLQAPTSEQDSGSLTMGLAIPPQMPLNFLQAAVPLAVGLLFLWRMSTGRSSPSHPGSALTASSQVAAG
jgi:HAAS